MLKAVILSLSLSLVHRPAFPERKKKIKSKLYSILASKRHYSVQVRDALEFRTSDLLKNPDGRIADLSEVYTVEKTQLSQRKVQELVTGGALSRLLLPSFTLTLGSLRVASLCTCIGAYCGHRLYI